jgi:hypothetical protein
MNMNTRWHDLKIDRLEDGGIRLEQSDCGEDCVIYLHPEQLLFIARQLCGMKPETAAKAADLERRIAVLTDKLQNIVCNKAFRSDLIEGIGEGFEYLAKLDGMLDLALEFDGGRLEPEEQYSEQQEGHSASKPIHPPSAIDQAKKTQHSAIAEAGEQLGLEV